MRSGAAGRAGAPSRAPGPGPAAAAARVLRCAHLSPAERRPTPRGVNERFQKLAAPRYLQACSVTANEREGDECCDCERERCWLKFPARKRSPCRSGWLRKESPSADVLQPILLLRQPLSKMRGVRRRSSRGFASLPAAGSLLCASDLCRTEPMSLLPVTALPLLLLSVLLHPQDLLLSVFLSLSPFPLPRSSHADVPCSDGCRATAVLLTHTAFVFKKIGTDNGFYACSMVSRCFSALGSVPLRYLSSVKSFHRFEVSGILRAVAWVCQSSSSNCV